jgi:hypothetical protein
MPHILRKQELPLQALALWREAAMDAKRPITASPGSHEKMDSTFRCGIGSKAAPRSGPTR